MFAIEINHENLEKIISHAVNMTDDEASGLTVFADSRLRPFYFISGYYNDRAYYDWTILPEFRMKEFDHDPVKIKTDWDQIVRK